ncbi:Protein Shroom2 [Liparis tanakae]|uniref:Protein Shroom2 n=1 Tax=Liparis tanakae TaxID=230148 RepID=A0A4Z2EWU3_9TELE|nr:Protein Shroom2 [Liparis tanakae]
MKMVDIVAQKMPSENDVHVARSFLTKILRSSMRRNEPISRPHSWHATKFNEGQSETAKAQAPPTQVWNARYDASSSSSDLSSGWEQTGLRRASAQFSSLGSVDSLEAERLGGGKRDSAYSSFSTGSGTPDHTLSRSNAASTENMLCRLGPWDAAAGGGAGGRPNHGQGAKPEERPAYLQMPGVDPGGAGPQADDAAGSRHSAASRSGPGPVWHVPEAKRKSAAPSPPPPAPPARSDSYAATKVHERGLGAAQPEAPESGRAGGAGDPRRGHQAALRGDADAPQNQRPLGDKSSSYSQPRAPAAPKPQSVGGYYCSMQELPTGGAAQHAAHRRNLSSSTGAAPAGQSADSSWHSRYYCVTAGQPAPGKPEERRSGAGPDPLHLPQQPLLGKDSNGYGQQVASGAEPGAEERAGPRGHEAPPTSHAAGRPAEPRRSLPPPQHQDARHHGRAGGQICPQATPMLHFLAMDDATGRDAAPRGPGAAESLDGQMARRSDRFATTLRNEIQTRRARLQKSASAAEGRADAESPAPPADGSFSGSYKEHLKEAQARVLKATSFRRRDLEPVLPEPPAPEAAPGCPPSGPARKDGGPLPTVSESGASTPGHVTRIGGRKRFSADKKGRSFSEPGKIHEVGVREDESSSLDPHKLRTESRAPPFLGHAPSRRGPASAGETEDTARPASGVREAPRSHQQLVLDQQRLGTFAEYEARWNPQNPQNAPPPGRHRSADNILEPEARSPACFHERSRSSPSTDIYGQVRSGGVPGGVCNGVACWEM